MSLDQYLKKFMVPNDDKTTPITHTKIGSHELNVYGGKYHIPDDKTNEFYKAYKKHVFQEKKQAYLTEKQLENGKILIDLDFRYSMEVETRQHSKDHIIDFIQMTMEGLCDIYQNVNSNHIEFYIFEKDNVNFCEDKNVTKDGIHIILNVAADFATKIFLREYLVEHIGEIWDLEIKNTWEQVVDEGVMRGHVNWQLFGSQKPGNECYKLKYIFDSYQDEIEEIDVMKIDFDEYFPKFCARNTDGLNKFRLQDKYIEKHEKYLTQTSKSKKKSQVKIKKLGGNINRCNDYENISSMEELDELIEYTFSDDEMDYKYKEIHKYTMVLGKEYWGPGSYDKWLRVGWALKNTHECMYLTWLKMSSQSEDFSFDNHDTYDYWCDRCVVNKEGLSKNSIIYWAKLSNPIEYEKIRRNSVDYFIYYSFTNSEDYDLANALYHMYKSQYVCASVKKEGIWYEFKNNIWKKNEGGISLKQKISKEFYKEYQSKYVNFQLKHNAQQNNIGSIQGNETKQDNEDSSFLNYQENTVLKSFQDSNEDFTDHKKKVCKMAATLKLLKNTSSKSRIMTESQLLFYEEDFVDKLNKNPYLIGCANCVIDFEAKDKNRGNLYRPGKPDDYISMSTNLIYKPIEYYEKHDNKSISEINEFFEQLFPDQYLRQYMWEHLASTLIGTIENQTFNIYNGSGANGKSKLVELMTLVLGDYKGTVPISLVTQKRTSIGGTSSEIANLIGKRYAVMQEPSKGDKINEGIMKELTGGDPIQCRALFENSVTFNPQFKLVVCTNTLFDITSNDDGTWRRLRKVDFESKFTENPNEDARFPVDQYPYQYKIDKKIDEKFIKWAPVLFSMLVDVAYKTKGKVTDVAKVTEATEGYRKDQDLITEFMTEHIRSKENKHERHVIEHDILSKFKDWASQMHSNSNRSIPSGKEVSAYMTDKYGPKDQRIKGWKNITYKESEAEEDENNNDFSM
jgi:P4 family phage/plasmid primase-like protien